MKITNNYTENPFSVCDRCVPSTEGVIKEYEMILTECQVAIHAGLREYHRKSKRAISLESRGGIWSPVLYTAS